MRKWIITAVIMLILVGILLPTISFTEDRDTVQLARVIYALSRNESYDVKLAIGSVVMNRVESKWFDNTLAGVLDDPHQFPAGERYDEESLNAAHAVVSGTRNLDRSLLYYHSSSEKKQSETGLTVGSYEFSTTDRLLTITGLL